MQRLHYVTLATKPHPNLDILLKLSAKLGLQPKVLGMSDMRMQSWGEAFGIKIEYIIQACSQLNERDILLYTDAYDIIPIASEKEILDAFLLLDADLVFGAEKACHPRQDLRGDFDRIHPKPKNPHRYLNAGFSIGYVGAYKRFVEMKAFHDKDDDQGYWAETFVRHHNTKGTFSTHAIRLDLNSTLVMNLFDARDDVTFTGGRYIRLSTGTKPCFLHLNGGAYDFDQFAAPLIKRHSSEEKVNRLWRFIHGSGPDDEQATKPLIVAMTVAALLVILLMIVALW